jgi:NAD(P)-dependent dehydrogenase (short-subunit alcohol dehydrogenase family)
VTVPKQKAEKKKAFVTGASRGIGKAIAVALAGAGFDVAITARTVEPGEQREHSSTVARSDLSPLPGSLRETAALIEQAGARALTVPADLLDRASLGAAAMTVLERWGAIDVVVHNARYIGPGHMDTLLAAPISAIENHMQGNFLAPLVLNKYFVPAMIEQGGGLIVDVTSGAAFGDPFAAAGEGGWGISYGSSKAALHRVAGILSTELAAHNVRVINVEPGFIATERIAQDMARFGFAANGEPPEVVGSVVAWLATDREAGAFNGTTVFAQDFCHERGLLPGWNGPTARAPGARPDLSGARQAAFDEKYGLTR